MESIVSDRNDQRLRESLDELARLTRFPIVFGGFRHDDSITITRIIGNRRDSLRGLQVRAGHGLGGRALAESRPRFTGDYASSTVISHEYDRAVLAEGITALLAVPVVDEFGVRAIMYGGLRDRSSIGDISIEPATKIAQQFASGLGSPKSSGRPADRPSPREPHGMTSAQREELRDVYAEIRGIRSVIEDPNTRARLATLEGRLAAIADQSDGEAVARAPRGLITARECDVLSLAALGWTNAAVGGSLGVTESTVKSYMNSAMRKLHAATRFEAVATARRFGLLP